MSFLVSFPALWIVFKSILLLFTCIRTCSLLTLLIYFIPSFLLHNQISKASILSPLPTVHVSDSYNSITHITCSTHSIPSVLFEDRIAVVGRASYCPGGGRGAADEPHKRSMVLGYRKQYNKKHCNKDTKNIPWITQWS